MIDLENEKLMRVSELRRKLKLENPPREDTIRLWIKDGRIGSDGERHKLEVVNVGGIIHTSMEAYHRFVRECSGESKS